MTDEELPNGTGEKVDDTTVDYIAAIKELKEKTVDRSKYDKLAAENKKLVESLVNGQTVQSGSSQPKYRDTKELKAILANETTSNLAYWTAFLELRDKVMEETGEDPVVSGGMGPNGKIIPEYGEREGMAEQMEIIRECIKIANGDEQVFINETSKRAR